MAKISKSSYYRIIRNFGTQGINGSTDVHSIIRGVCTSELRSNILLSLNDQSMSLGNLKAKVKSDAPNTSAKARELESIGLIERKNGGYHLTSFGGVVKTKLEEFEGIIDVFTKHEIWWKNHYYQAIPKEFLDRMHVFSDATLMKDSNTSPEKTYDNDLDIVSQTKKRLLGVVKIYSNRCLDSVLDCLKKGIDVKLITSPDIAQHVLEPEHYANFKKILNYPTFTGRLAEVGFTFLLTDNIISIGFCFSDDHKRYDWGSALISGNPEAVKWGEDLFEYYWKRAQQVDFKEIEQLAKSAKAKKSLSK